MFKIQTLQNNERMSTQDLLQAISAAVAAGETDFYIEASGQHNIGGPLWHPEGKTLPFHVKNPGQRVGCMCLDNTEVYVEGAASADVGWLNAGGKIVVRGDGTLSPGSSSPNILDWPTVSSRREVEQRRGSPGRGRCARGAGVGPGSAVPDRLTPRVKAA